MKPQDVTIQQEAKVLIAALLKNLPKEDGRGITLNMNLFQNVGVGGNRSIQKKEEISDTVIDLLDLMPEPRWKNLMKTILGVVNDECKNRTEAAKYLGLGRTTYTEKLKKHNLLSCGVFIPEVVGSGT